MTTDRSCKVSTVRYIRLVAGMIFRRWAWVIVAPFVAAAVLSFYDLRFLFVTLMLLFVVTPLLLMFIYIYYGLTPEARFSILPKTLSINQQRIIAEFEPLGEDYPTPPPVKLDLKRVSSVEYRKDCYALIVDRRRFRPVVIPYSAFSDKEQISEFSSILNKRH